MPAMPLSSMFVSMTCPENPAFGESTADELHADRQSFARETARHAERRYTAKIEGFRENIADNQSLPFLEIELERVFGFLTRRV